MSKAYIYDALRSPRGDGRPGGALYQVKPVQLLARCLQALHRRSQVTDLPLEVDDLIIGCNTPTADQGYNIARAGLLHAGWRMARGGMQINRFNTSSLEAINLAAARIEAGYDDLIIAGGLECMSRVPTWLNRGPMMNDPETIINSHYIPQGVAADLVATTEGLTRSDLDAFAIRSHRLAAEAHAQGRFHASIETIFDANGLEI
ncbi:MAG: acetyl-CoA C-acyltransferase, partial [Bacteroidota bacterium]